MNIMVDALTRASTIVFGGSEKGEDRTMLSLLSEVIRLPLGDHTTAVALRPL